MSCHNAGKLGEDVCVTTLQSLGYEIVTRNYHSRYGEIDLVAQKDHFIVFVEVKTRKKDGIALPREYVDRKKQRKIVKTALCYLMETSNQYQPRFDVFEVYLHSVTGEVAGFHHIINAFEAGDIDALF